MAIKMTKSLSSQRRVAAKNVGQGNSGASPFKTGLSNEHFFKSCVQVLLGKKKKKIYIYIYIYVYLGSRDNGARG